MERIIESRIVDALSGRFGERSFTLEIDGLIEIYNIA